MKENDLEKRIIWLAGLLSTDGSIIKLGNSLSFLIFSIEEDWIKVIQNRLLEIGIESTLRNKKYYGAYGNHLTTLYIKNPFKIKQLIEKYALDYLNPRKREILLSSYLGAPNRKWTKREDELLRTLYNKNIMKKIIVEKASELLNRTKWGISHRLFDMGMKKNANK